MVASGMRNMCDISPIPQATTVAIAGRGAATLGVVALLALAACTSPETERAAHAPSPRRTEVAPAEAPELGAAEAREAPVSARLAERVCARATECCTAFAEAIGPSVRGSCDATRQTARADRGTAALACQISIDAWRGALEARGLEVPAACR
jgi:hypothetical protein